MKISLLILTSACLMVACKNQTTASSVRNDESADAVPGTDAATPSDATQAAVAAPQSPAANPTAPAERSLLAEFCLAMVDIPFSTIRERATVLAAPIPGDESDIITDPKGQRVLKTFAIENCGAGRGAVTIRFTDDQGGGLWDQRFSSKTKRRRRSSASPSMPTATKFPRFRKHWRKTKPTTRKRTRIPSSARGRAASNAIPGYQWTTAWSAPKRSGPARSSSRRSPAFRAKSRLICRRA